MPSRLVSPTIVGRQRELVAIEAALDRASDGQPTHVLIAGEAGVGKSRIVAETSILATQRGWRVLAGGCANVGEGGLPYGPLVEILRSLLGTLGTEEVDRLVAGGRADLASLVPSFGEGRESTGVAGGTQQARLYDAVLGLLHRLAAEGPVLIVIEDLHWADQATRDIVAFLVRGVRTDRILLLLTFRSDELHRRHPLLPWLAELERGGRIERIDLARLDTQQTHELVTAITGARPTAEYVARIHARSDGNPFFIEELLVAGEDGAEGRLPPNLRGVLIARMASLPEHAQAVVGVAAVAGRRVEHDVLAEVAGIDDVALLDGLRSAVASQVLVTGEGDGTNTGYAFRHALLQEAAYDDLLPGERHRLHRAFAEALEARPPGAGAVEAGYWAELAHHWLDARDDRRAFEASVRAGTTAAQAYAFADARRHDERALELWPGVDDPEDIAGIDRAALLDRAGEAAWLGGDARRAAALHREAIAALGTDGDPIRKGTYLERWGRALWNTGDGRGALEACQAAVASIPSDPPTAERARVLSGYGQLLMLHDRRSESIAMCEEAVAIARQVGARQAEGHALNTLGFDYAADGRCDEGLAALETAIVIAREIGNADDIGRGYANLSEAVGMCRGPRAALEVVHEGIAETDAVGVTGTYGSFIREHGVVIAFDLGDWEAAARLAADSYRIEQAGDHQDRYMLGHIVQLLVATGDGTAAERLDDLAGLIEDFRAETQFNAPFRAAVAEHALWRGAPDDALTSIREGLAEVQLEAWHWTIAPLFRFGYRAAADLAEAARARRDGAGVESSLAAIAELDERLEPFAALARRRRDGRDIDDTEAELATVEAERARAAGRPDAAVWAHAAERWEAREKPYPVAYCRWRQGEAATRAGDRAAATEALREARSIAERLGARPLLGEIEALALRARLDLGLAAAGASDGGNGTGTTAAATDSDPFGLTPRERDVIPLLVLGRTNRQIADELFISESTAGVHVSNILGKLGATTRTEAAAIAVRSRLDRAIAADDGGGA